MDFASARPSSSLSKESRRKIVEGSPPRQPLMRRSGKLEVHVMDARLGQRIAELFHARPFHRAGGKNGFALSAAIGLSTIWSTCPWKLKPSSFSPQPCSR